MSVGALITTIKIPGGVDRGKYCKD